MADEFKLTNNQRFFAAFAMATFGAIVASLALAAIACGASSSSNPDPHTIFSPLQHPWSLAFGPPLSYGILCLSMLVGSVPAPCFPRKTKPPTDTSTELPTARIHKE